MFEIIGLIIGTVIVLVLASFVGLVYTLIAWLILPRRADGRNGRLVLAFMIPILSVIYLGICTAGLPGESLFGDIDQPLPNAYALTALGKMPEYGEITYRGNKAVDVHIGGSVDMLAVNGPLVAGRYCQSCDVAFVQSKEPYFVLDTRIAQSADCHDLAEVQKRMGQSVELVETQFFRSKEPSYRRQQQANRLIMDTPPILGTILYFTYLVYYRRRESMRLATTPYQYS